MCRCLRTPDTAFTVSGGGKKQVFVCYSPITSSWLLRPSAFASVAPHALFIPLAHRRLDVGCILISGLFPACMDYLAPSGAASGPWYPVHFPSFIVFKVLASGHRYPDSLFRHCLSTVLSYRHMTLFATGFIHFLQLFLSLHYIYARQLPPGGSCRHQAWMWLPPSAPQKQKRLDCIAIWCYHIYAIKFQEALSVWQRFQRRRATRF